MKKIYLLVLAAFLTISLNSFAQDSIPASQAASNYNKHVKIYGTVTGGIYLEKSDITLLNVDGAYPNNALTIMIKGTDRAKFSFKPEQYFKSKKIVVQGVVINYKDKPEIIVTDPKQLTIVPI